MHVEPNILFTVHEGAPFVGGVACAHNLLQKGRPFIMRLRQWGLIPQAHIPDLYRQAHSNALKRGRIVGMKHTLASSAALLFLCAGAVASAQTQEGQEVIPAPHVRIELTLD